MEFMGIYGYLCIYLVIYGGKYGYIWVYMGIYEGKYGYMGHIFLEGYYSKNCLFFSKFDS